MYATNINSYLIALKPAKVTGFFSKIKVSNKYYNITTRNKYSTSDLCMTSIIVRETHSCDHQH